MNCKITPADKKNSHSPRIEYIDALRGLTMLLVVFCHVSGFVWGVPDKNIPSVHQWLIQIRMPMFFFISGFVLYKAGIVWDFMRVIKFLRKKFMVQIIPTLVFLTLFTHVMGLDLSTALFAPAKDGYWFTYVLFLYFLFYAIAQFCFRRFAYMAMLLGGYFYYLLLGLL